jgi:hypothetical protein
LTGTPAIGTAGVYPLTFTATSSAGTASQAFNLVVGQPPVFTSTASTEALTGQAFSFAITTEGPPAPTITRTGTLPGGVTFTAGPNGTATLSGTPGASSYGTYPLTLTATNVYGTTRQSFTLTVNKTPVIFSSDATTFTVDTSGTFTVRSEAFPRATMTMSGTLPAGLSFTPNANGTAVLSGTPAVGTGGQYPLEFTATSSIGSSTQNFTLTVREAPKITSPNAVSFTRGQQSNFIITTTGWPRPKITRTGTMPPGTTFTDNGNGTATIGGTAGTAGTWTLTIGAKNLVGSVSQTLTVRVT